jgi:hypothetical protein
MSSRNSFGRIVALAAALVAFVSAPVAAQRAQSWELAAFGGGYFGSTVYEGQISNTGPVVSVGANSAGLYGARLGYTIQRQFGLEFSWSASDPSLSFGSGFATGYTGDLSVNNFDFDAMFNFGQQRIWGYLALGMGWSEFSPSVQQNGVPIQVRSQSYFSGNTALGMKAFLTPHLAVQLDARYRWSNTNHNTGSGVSCVYYCYAYASTWYGASEISGGLTYVFFK